MEQFQEENKESEVNGFAVCSYSVNDHRATSDFPGYSTSPFSNRGGESGKPERSFSNRTQVVLTKGIRGTK